MKESSCANNFPYRLGLDLGTNSIGWAVLALEPTSKEGQLKKPDNQNLESQEFQPLRLENMGVRIFSDGRDKSGNPPSIARRIARGMRRRRDRFLARKNRLLKLLIETDLLPKDENQRKNLSLLNPYELRTKALDEALNLHEFGRAILHLNQRRGFQSNRKEIVKNDEKSKTTASIETDDARDDKNSKKTEKPKEISDDEKRKNLQKAIEETGSRTVGEYLFKHRLEKCFYKKEEIENNPELTNKNVGLEPVLKFSTSTRELFWTDNEAKFFPDTMLSGKILPKLGVSKEPRSEVERRFSTGGILRQALTTRSKPDENALYVQRSQVKQEFEAIWQAQKNFHLQHQTSDGERIFSAENFNKIHEAIFFQRPLKPQELGFCQFLNIFNEKNLPVWAVDELNRFLKENSKKEAVSKKGVCRAYLALPSFIKFRILSDIANLEIKNSDTGEVISLTANQRQTIFDVLNKAKKEITFKALRKLISASKSKSKNKGKSLESQALEANDLFGICQSDKVPAEEIDFTVECFSFNLESKNRTKLDGNPTENLLADDRYFGESWWQIPLKQKDEIVGFLLEAEKEERIYEAALQQWNLGQEKAKNLSLLKPQNFKSGTAAMSAPLLRKLCEQFEKAMNGEIIEVLDEKTGEILWLNQPEQKFTFDKAMLVLGIKHSEENFGDGKYDLLPYYGEAIPASVVTVKSGSDEEMKYGKIANPTVHIALNQLRKVVNELIKTYGKPCEINVELARELRSSKKQKEDYQKQQKKNEAENKEIDAELARSGYPTNYENRLRFKLFEELKIAENVAICPFSRETISISQLFSSSVNIEHILPFSQTLDDSFANKTLATQAANMKKANRSPFEAFGDDEEKYREILQRTKNFPKNKRWRFEPDAMEKFKDQSGFLVSQLNDTRYISKLARQYLATICPNKKISVGNGRITAVLRHVFGLNSVLLPKKKEDKNLQSNQHLQGLEGEFAEAISLKNSNQHFQEIHETTKEEISEENSGENSEKKSSESVSQKNRNDHRHHAIDALCVAMTDRALLKKFSDANAAGFDLSRSSEFLCSNLKFKKDKLRARVAELAAKIVVSHKLDHGKETQFHDETYYGLLKERVLVKNSKKNPTDCNLVVSSSITALKKNDAFFVRDKKWRECLIALASKATTDKEFQEKLLPEFSKKTGVKNIRLFDSNNSILEISHPAKQPIHHKIVKTNGNHHLALWQLPNGEFKTAVVSNFEMNSIYKVEFDAKRGVKVVNKNHKFSVHQMQKQPFDRFKPHPAAKLILRLIKGDMVRLEENGAAKIARIVKFTGITCTYRVHNTAKALESDMLSKKDMESTFQMNADGIKEKKIRKIFVSPIGVVKDPGPILKD